LIYGIHNLKVSGVISAVPSVSLQDGHAGYISGFQPEIASYGIGDSGKAYCSRIQNVIGTVKSRLLEDNYITSKECKFTRAFLTDELRFAVKINDDGDWALAEWAVPLPREDG